MVTVGVGIGGLAVSASGRQCLLGGVFYRIGLAAYVPTLTTTNGLLLLLAVGLILLPMAARVRVQRPQRSAAIFTLVVIAALAAITGGGALLAVRAQLHRLALFHQKVDTVRRRLLFTSLAGTLGTSAGA